MGNTLTGEFDIVAEFGVGAINRILAAQHQLSGPDQMYLHSIRTTIRPDVVQGVWGIAEIQISTPKISLPEESGPPGGGTSAAPAPIPSSLLGMFEAPEMVAVLPDTDIIVRGDGSRVTVHFDIRVRFRPDQGSASAPEIVHGELQVTVTADQVLSPAVDVVSIRLDTDDMVVTFTPATSAALSSAESDMVEAAARHFLASQQKSLSLMIDLPPTGGGFGVSHWRFKTLPHNSRPAVALLLNMSRDRFPTSDQREAYSNLFLEDGNGFAFAIGRDFLVPLLRRVIEEQIQQGVGSQTYTVGLGFWSATYHISLDGQPQVDLETGAIRVRVSLDATTSSDIAPNVSLTLTQRLHLSVASGNLRLRLIGGLDLDLNFSGSVTDWIFNLLRPFFKGPIKNAVSGALEQAVIEAQPLLRSTLSRAAVLIEHLRIPPPQLSYTRLSVTTDGIAIHGDLSVSNWQPVVVAFDSRRLLSGPPDQLVHQLELTALRSWIPGGIIQHFRWLLSTGDAPIADVEHDDQFTMKPPASIQSFNLAFASWCLEVTGVQDGRVVTGSNCGLIGPPVVAWPRNGDGSGDNGLSLPVGVRDQAGNLVAHVDLSGRGLGRRRDDSDSTNILVYFAGSDPEATPSLVRQLGQQLGFGERSLMIISVVEPGTPIPVRSSEHLDTLNVVLIWAEDFEGGWADAFKAGEERQAVLLVPQNAVVWRSSAKPSVGEIAEALDHHLKPTRLLPSRLLRPGVRENERAPNLYFDFSPGTTMKLSTLRGRPVHVTFFKTWSQPCDTELRRLQTLHENGEAVLAVADGQQEEMVKEYIDRRGYKFRVVADPDRQISRRYGISAWPTTIAVDDGGVTRQIRMGIGIVSDSPENGHSYRAT